MERWKKLLQLDTAWDVDTVAVGTAEEGTEAYMKIISADSYKARLELTPEFIGSSDAHWRDNIESTVAHELIHVLKHEIDSFVEMLCDMASRGKGAKALKEQYERLDEQVIHKIEHAIGELLKTRKKGNRTRKRGN